MSSSDEEELDIGPRSTGWQNGKPLEITDRALEGEERLDRCLKALDRLSKRIEDSPEYVNDELEQELQQAKQVSVIQLDEREVHPYSLVPSCVRAWSLACITRLIDSSLTLLATTNICRK